MNDCQLYEIICSEVKAVRTDILNQIVDDIVDELAHKFDQKRMDILIYELRAITYLMKRFSEREQLRKKEKDNE